MAERRYLVGERVLASRDGSGEGHEEATVYDFYELLIGSDRTPQVVVDFDDGERVYLVAREPVVRPLELDEEPDAEGDDDPDFDPDLDGPDGNGSAGRDGD